MSYAAEPSEPSYPPASPNSYYQHNQARQYQQPWGGPHAPTDDDEKPPCPQSPPSPSIYALSPPAYPSSPIKPVSEEKLGFDEAFVVEKPKWNDIWASVLFTLICIGFIAVSGVAISGYKSAGTSDKNATLSLNIYTIALFALIVLIAFLFSLIYFLMIRNLTKQIIYITAIAQIVMGLITAVVYFILHNYAAGVIFMLATIIYIFCFLSWRRRIPFSVLMLQTVIDVSKSYGHVFVVSSLGGLFATGFSIYFSITLVGIYAKYHPGGAACSADGSCSMATVGGLIVFITFAAFWITEVIKNVIHVTISGVYGSWYFCSQKPGGFPKGATAGAFRRATTYSFGSISFGSLLVAIVQFVRQIFSVVQAEEQAEGNVVGMIFSRFLGCFIGFLDWLIELINEYAFSYIALYGKAYIPAAKDTWRMLRSRGVDILINECIINPVLTMGAVFVAYLCAFVAFLYLEIAKPLYNSKGGYTPVVMVVAFLLGLQICNIFLVPIKSGLATFFVAMSFDPEVLENDYPDLYKEMVVLHPKVKECVHPGA